MRKTMALFIILFEIFKQCVMALTGAPIDRNLPLHVCSFAEYAMLADAMWPDERFLRQAFLYLFLPAAVMAVTFPTVTAYPAVNFYTIHQFVLHSGMAAYIIARYACGEFVPTYRGVRISLAQFLPIGYMIYLIDFGFDKNYMFLSSPSGNTMLTALWNISGGSGGVPYFASLILFTIVIQHVFYGIYRLIGAISSRRAKKTQG